MTHTVRWVFVIVVLSATMALGQVQGQNIVSDSTGSPKISPSFVDATQFMDSDGCKRINLALTSTPASGGFSNSLVVDARGLVGDQTCSSNPWASFSGEATVLLGAATWKTNTPWVIPGKNRLFGIGIGDAETGNTVIQWNGSSSTSSPMITLGTVNQDPGVFVGDLSINCLKPSTSITAAIGLQNLVAQEGSGANNVAIVDCPTNALNVGDVPGTSTSQNSGPYTNLKVNYTPTGNVCTSSTVPVKYFGISKRGIKNLTMTANGCTTNVPSYGITINSNSASSQTTDVFENIHCENVNTSCLEIGNTAATNSIVVSGVTGCPTSVCDDVVRINNSFSGTGDIVVSGINKSSSGAAVEDQIGGNIITDQSLGFYAVGHGSLAPIVSTSPNAIVGTVPGIVHLNAWWNTSITPHPNDFVGNCTLGPSGACSVTFRYGYNSAPICVATEAGSTSLPLRVASTTTGLTITSLQSTDTSVVNYMCVGHPN